MASGQNHFQASLILNGLAIPISFVVLPLDSGISFSVGLIFGTFCTPDVRDIERSTYPSYILSRVPLIGTVLSYGFRLFWYPLALILPHRSRFSHQAGLGTFIAFLYLLGISSCLISVVFDLDYFLNLLKNPQNLLMLLFFFLGWLFQDILHLFLDR